MSLTADAVVAVFERRYDYFSARTVFRASCDQAGIEANGPFDADALAALADAVLAIGDRADTVADALRAAAPPAQPAPPANKQPAPKPKAKPKAEGQPNKPQQQQGGNKKNPPQGKSGAPKNG